MSRYVVGLVAAGVLLVVFGSAAYAGGWAVVTLDELPTAVVVNEPLRVGFTVLQHGRTPRVCDCVRVRAWHSTGESLITDAVMDEAGHYSAELTFEREGTWQWAVASGLMPAWQPMPELNAVGPSADEAQLVAQARAASTTEFVWSTIPMQSAMPLALGILGMLCFGGGFALWQQAKRRGEI